MFVPVSDREEALGAEGALGVDVEALALAAALIDGQLKSAGCQRGTASALGGGTQRGGSYIEARADLAGDGERVAELRFAGAELAENLGDRAGLEAA